MTRRINAHLGEVEGHRALRCRNLFTPPLKGESHDPDRIETIEADLAPADAPDYLDERWGVSHL